ncbi:alpha/beta hydrolase [Gordonia rhizosphera]|nr:alpha/beta hydrolase [Gordonia rhizosphera]
MQHTTKGRSGMDPRGRTLAAWLDLVGWPNIVTRTPEQARIDYQILVATTTRRTIGGWSRSTIASSPEGHEVPVRVYWPRRRRIGAPIVVWMHGGGFVIGDLFTADATCRKLANYSSAVVVSVDYRRSPEVPITQSHEDARTAIAWAYRHAAQLGADRRRLIVAGDSAGGNMAAAACCHFRDHAGAGIAGQILIYPATDLTLAHMDHTAASGFFDGAAIEWFGLHSLTGIERTDPTISPLFADSHAGLPPAHIVLGGADPFCPDGRAYARALEAAGNQVLCEEFPRQMHGFVDMDGIFPSGHSALKSIAETVAGVSPVPGGVPTVPDHPIRWYSLAAETERRLDESWLRTPMANTARILSTLAAERWRGPRISPVRALTRSTQSKKHRLALDETSTGHTTDATAVTND